MVINEAAGLSALKTGTLISAGVITPLTLSASHCSVSQRLGHGFTVRDRLITDGFGCVGNKGGAASVTVLIFEEVLCAICDCYSPKSAVRAGVRDIVCIFTLQAFLNSCC